METRLSGAKAVKRNRVIHYKSLLFDGSSNANSFRKVLYACHPNERHNERRCAVGSPTAFTVKSQNLGHVRGKGSYA